MPASPHPSASLQQAFGNQAVARLMRAGVLQPKLRVSAPGDNAEREADCMAERVMRMPETQLRPACACGCSGSCHHHHAEQPGQKDESLEMKRAGDLGQVVPFTVQEALRSPGQPLDAATRSFMEPRFGYDFGRVRVHADAPSELSAAQVNALAYTVGPDIVFGSGQYAPGSAEGKRLLAHELTHVVQQSGSDAANGPPLVVARKTGSDAPAAALPTSKAMARDEARTVLLAYIGKAGVDDTGAALMAIADTLNTSSTKENWKTRLLMLRAAFSLLEPGDAALVLKTLTAPVGAKQEHLHRRFLRIDRDFRDPLLEILHERASAKPAKEPEQEDKPSADTSRRGTATWIELHPGVFAYVPNPGMTLDNVAAYVSGHPDVPAALADLNGLSRRTPLPPGQSVIIPIEFIERARAFGEMPDAVRSSILGARQAQINLAAFRRHMVVRPGLGVGLVPLTTMAIQGAVTALKRLIEKAEYAIAFVGGVIHGFLKSVWDAVAGIAKLIYDLIKSIISGDLISDIKELVSSITKLSVDKIKEAVGEWAAEWAEKLSSPNPWTAGHAHGYLTGYVMAEAAMLLLSGGAIEELKGAIWASKFGELAKGSRAFRTLESSILKVRQAARAAGGKLGEGLEALRQSRVGKAVKVAEATGAAVVWTADKVKRVLNLPSEIAQYVVEKAVAHARQLGNYFERIGELTDSAKRWLFRCASPCPWEPDAVARTMERLTNKQIEEEASKAGRLAKIRQVHQERYVEGTARHLEAEEAHGEVTHLPPERPAVKAEPRARGYAHEDAALARLYPDYRATPAWFKAIDGFKPETAMKKYTYLDREKTIIVYERPDVISHKSTTITDAVRLDEKIGDDVRALRDFTEGTRRHRLGDFNIEIQGARRRKLVLTFDEEAEVQRATIKVLESWRKRLKDIDFEWYIARGTDFIPGREYIKSLGQPEL